jgi:hypothetical protein
VDGSSARSLIDLDRGVHVVYSRERELRRCTLMAGHYDPGVYTSCADGPRAQGVHLGCGAQAGSTIRIVVWTTRHERCDERVDGGCVCGVGWGGVGGGGWGWGGGYTLFYETWSRLVGGRQFPSMRSLWDRDRVHYEARVMARQRAAVSVHLFSVGLRTRPLVLCWSQNTVTNSLRGVLFCRRGRGV